MTVYSDLSPLLLSACYSCLEIKVHSPIFDNCTLYAGRQANLRRQFDRQCFKTLMNDFTRGCTLRESGSKRMNCCWIDKYPTKPDIELQSLPLGLVAIRASMWLCRPPPWRPALPLRHPACLLLSSNNTPQNGLDTLLNHSAFVLREQRGTVS